MKEAHNDASKHYYELSSCISILLPLSLALMTALYTCTPLAAADTVQARGLAYLGKADCRIAPLEPAPDKGEISWTGGCADGYASGKGMLTWNVPTVSKVTLEATLVRGEASGEVVLKTSRFTYAGTMRNGVPNGEGYFQFEGRGWYEGEVANGLPHGKGTFLNIDRSRYTGDWVQGKRHGQGRATFATGGSYTGSWKDDVFDGQGAVVYAGAGHKFQGLFQDGRIAGLPKAAAVVGRYGVDGEVGKGPNRDSGVVAYLPMQASWNDLTPAQKNAFIRNYPALEAGDEPPFPLKGEAGLFDKVSRMNHTFGVVKGSLGVYVLVGKDGKPLSVTAYGAPTATIVRALSTVYMLEQYKPARCRGEPCEMVYAVNFTFTVDD